MPKTPDDLFAFLDGIGIRVTTVWHEPLFTVEQSQALRGNIPGAHTKNLFLKDRKDQFFLLTMGEDTAVNLKTIHEVIGASGRVSFGKPEMLLELMGVTPGGVTLFGALNDSAGRVRIVLDEALMQSDIVNAHPLTNAATSSISARDVASFLTATGHGLHVLKLGSGSPHATHDGG